MPPRAGSTDGAAIRIYNERGEMRARAHVTRADPGRHGVDARRLGGLNVLTSGAPVMPDAAVDIFGFSAGQATFDASIEVAPVTENVGQASGGPGTAGPRSEEGSRS